MQTVGHCSGRQTAEQDVEGRVKELRDQREKQKAKPQPHAGAQALFDRRRQQRDRLVVGVGFADLGAMARHGVAVQPDAAPQLGADKYFDL